MASKKGRADPDVGSFIAPLIQGKRRNDVGNFHLKGDDTRQATVVRFDVQVATEESTGREGGGSVKARLVVVDVSLAGGGTSSDQRSSLHRLEFAVAVEIPSPVPDAV